MRDLRIMVHTIPSYHDNPNDPYFWCVMEYQEGIGLTNSGSGWANTELKAFNAARKWVAFLNKPM